MTQENLALANSKSIMIKDLKEHLSRLDNLTTDRQSKPVEGCSLTVWRHGWDSVALKPNFLTLDIKTVLDLYFRKVEKEIEKLEKELESL